MPKKKHPILIVFLVLGIVAIFLGGVMAIVISMIGPSSSLSLGTKIGVIPILGTITDSGPILNQLIKFKKDRKIKAIILRIDSPGGGVGPSQEIYREVRKTIRQKQIIASMGSTAASGGYYIASAANKIIANPGTLTGSIGVIMEFVRLDELLKKLGINLEVLKTGEFKDVGSFHREITERERELLNTLLSDIQTQFVEDVAKGRRLPSEKVREIADGRIMTGAQAKDLGLVDNLGNFQDAVDLAKKMAGVQGEVVLVYPKTKRANPLEYFMESAVESMSRVISDKLNSQFAYKWDGLPK